MQGLWKKADLPESKGFEMRCFAESYESPVMVSCLKWHNNEIQSRFCHILNVFSWPGVDRLESDCSSCTFFFSLPWAELTKTFCLHCFTQHEPRQSGPTIQTYFRKIIWAPRLPWSPVCSQEGLGIHSSTQFRLQANPCRQLGSHSRTQNKNKTHPL